MVVGVAISVEAEFCSKWLKCQRSTWPGYHYCREPDNTRNYSTRNQCNTWPGYPHGQSNTWPGYPKEQHSNSWPGYPREQCSNTWPGYPREQHSNSWPGYPRKQHSNSWPGYPREQHNNTWPGYVSNDLGCIPEHVRWSFLQYHEDHHTYHTTGVYRTTMLAL